MAVLPCGMDTSTGMGSRELCLCLPYFGNYQLVLGHHVQRKQGTFEPGSQGKWQMWLIVKSVRSLGERGIEVPRWEEGRLVLGQELGQQNGRRQGTRMAPQWWGAHQCDSQLGAKVWVHWDQGAVNGVGCVLAGSGDWDQTKEPAASGDGWGWGKRNRSDKKAGGGFFSTLKTFPKNIYTVSHKKPSVPHEVSYVLARFPDPTQPESKAWAYDFHCLLLFSIAPDLVRRVGQGLTKCHLPLPACHTLVLEEAGISFASSSDCTCAYPGLYEGDATTVHRHRSLRLMGRQCSKS